MERDRQEKKAGKPRRPFRLIARLKDGTLREALDDWRWIFRYSAGYKGAILLYVILGIASTSFGLAGSVAAKYMIDIITGYQASKLAVLIAVMTASSLISLLLESLVSRMNARLNLSINNDIQADVFDKIMDTDWMAMNSFSNGDVLNRFNDDVRTVSSNAISWLPTVIVSIYKFAATLLVIWHYDRVLALIALGSAPFLILCSRVLVKKQREHSKKVREMSSRLMTFEVESFYNYDTIKSFGVAPRYSEKMRWWQEKFRKVSLDFNLFSIKTNILMSVLEYAMMFFAFFYCLFRLWMGDITFGTMTLFLQQRSSLTSAFNRIASMVPAFLNSSVSAGRIREIVELPREIHIRHSSEWDARIREGFEIQIRNVSVSYIQGKNVIRGASFFARPGEIIALVGSSGEGKTTVLRLLTGLIRPQQGQVVVVDSSGRETQMNAETRHLFAYVPQGNTIFSGTVEENLRMVREDATEEEMENALRIACAWEFVRRMPKGIHTTVGEKGRGLSEGQAQRIAIARAVLRDAPVLLLDEATSALDVATERRVLKNIIRSQPEKICIIATHRPSVLGMCRRVYRVKDAAVTVLPAEEAERMAMDY